MRKRQYIAFSFAFFFIISLILFLLSKTSIGGSLRGLEVITKPIGSGITQIFHAPDTSEIGRLQKENRNLIQKLSSFQTLERENRALRDQFETPISKTLLLLPSDIVAMPRSLPGISKPEYMVLERGTGDKVRIGQGVIVDDVVIGKVHKVSVGLSEVTLVTSKNFTLAAKSARTGALGVIKGTETGEMILDNVLLSEDIKKDDVIVTAGDTTTDGIGMPADLILGTVISVDKKPSALFQTAKIKSILDIDRLSTVFVVMGYKN
jgi:rod shape-determining protein MreC